MQEMMHDVTSPVDTKADKLIQAATSVFKVQLETRALGPGLRDYDITSCDLQNIPTIASMSSSVFNALSGWLYNTSEGALIQILSSGPIPQHVGFVMDANRRYARRKQRAVQEGHAEGYVALRRVREPTES